MRKIDMKVLLPILGLGALAFALGSSKKGSGAVTAARPVQPGVGVRVQPVSASELAGYPSAESTGDVSDQPVATNIKLRPVKLAQNGGAS